jgi:hypothetical protein
MNDNQGNAINDGQGSQGANGLINAASCGAGGAGTGERRLVRGAIGDARLGELSAFKPVEKVARGAWLWSAGNRAQSGGA